MKVKNLIEVLGNYDENLVIVTGTFEEQKSSKILISTDRISENKERIFIHLVDERDVK